MRDSALVMLAETQTIDQVTKVVVAALKMAGEARRAKDIPALEQAIELQQIALRAGGQMLAALTEEKRSELDLGEKLKCRMVRVAALTPDEFEKKLGMTRQKGVVRVTAAARLRMVASPWVADADGALTRTVTAVEADAGHDHT
jgi:hypothetical protein